MKSRSKFFTILFVVLACILQAAPSQPPGPPVPEEPPICTGPEPQPGEPGYGPDNPLPNGWYFIPGLGWFGPDNPGGGDGQPGEP